MALRRGISGGGGSGSGSPIRIFGPRDLEDNFLIDEVEDEIEPVVAKIRSIHRKVSVDLDERQLVREGGFCFGLLDPLSNILVNTIIPSAVAAASTSRIPYPLVVEEGEEGEGAPDMCTRSAKGLVAFLTYLFPYLPNEEAAAYLDAAGADPFVAALIIIRRRGMSEFNACSGTTMEAVETALRCAAVAARHPDPQKLVLGWKLLSPSLNRFSKLRPRMQDFVSPVLDTIRAAAGVGTTICENPWHLAQHRLNNIMSMVRESLLPPTRPAMKRMLLETIHGFYLQALARLPTAELCTRYHHSMLMGGYCYGPLDPVSNIIVNTIWFEQRFPPRNGLIMKMISTVCLWRVVARSLYGLISFLCTRYPALSPDQAMHRLLVTGANLQLADPNLCEALNAKKRRDYKLNWIARRSSNWQNKAVEPRSPTTSIGEAYAAAATAAFHPDPCAQQELLGSQSAMATLQVASEVLQQGHILSAKDIVLLSGLFSRRSSSVSKRGQHQEPASIDKWGYAQMSTRVSMFWDQHVRICSKVKAALDTFNEDKVSKYSIHTICGVNELTSGPEYSRDPEVRGYNPWTPFKYHHSHINFLANCEESERAGLLPTLFFAECSNHGDDTSWCIPVDPLPSQAEHVRCIYCECQGKRIVHPAIKNFHGRGIEFEKVLLGEPLFHGSGSDRYNNDDIMTYKEVEVDWVGAVTDDYIYSFDYTGTDAAAAAESTTCDDEMFSMLQFMEVC